MRVPKTVFVVCAALALLAGGLGFIAGVKAGVTETEVISAGAALWNSETGGAVTACVGVPGGGEVWIEVRCTDAGDSRTYLFDERGRRLAPSKEPRA